MTKRQGCKIRGSCRPCIAPLEFPLTTSATSNQVHRVWIREWRGQRAAEQQESKMWPIPLWEFLTSACTSHTEKEETARSTGSLRPSCKVVTLLSLIGRAWPRNITPHLPFLPRHRTM